MEQTREESPLPEKTKRAAKWKRYLKAGAVLLFMYLCGPLFWLGFPTFTLLAGADRVQVFKIDPNYKEALGQDTAVGYHRILAEGRPLSRSERSRLKSVLLTPTYYIVGPLDVLACRMSPGIAFRLWRGKQYANVLACYQCAHISVETCNEQGERVREYHTPFPVTQLSGLVRASFPGDKELAGALSRYEVNKEFELDERRKRL